MSDVSDAVASTALRVTFFEDRAEVEREATVALHAGTQWVAIGGVSPFVDDRTLQARVAGAPTADASASGVTVLSARVRRVVRNESALPSSEIEELERLDREARRRVRDCQADLSRCQGMERRAAFLLSDWLDAIAQVPKRAADEDRVAEWRLAYSQLDHAVSSAQAAGAAAQRELQRARDEHARTSLRLAQARLEKPRHETTVEVQIDARAAGTATVRVSYRTPCALWRPEHVARLHADARIEIVTWATAWQSTGETWSDVEARFSTARTARAATPPLVSDDVLFARRKSDWEKKRVVVEARDEEVSVVGLDRGTRAVEEMPGLDDGGEPKSFAPTDRVSIASDGRPFRVEIARTMLPAEVTRILRPERAAAAHLRATATLSGAGSLLAGPVRLARDGGVVGRSKIGFISAGEPFELGFGVDDSVRVRRSVDQSRDTTAIVGTQKLKRTVRLHLSNLSAEPKRVEVTERIPVSEIEEVEVAVTRGEWKVDAKDGFARQVVELLANQTRSLTLVYEVRASSKVAMPF